MFQSYERYTLYTFYLIVKHYLYLLNGKYLLVVQLNNIKSLKVQ